ncbi:3-keto-5-aminohexanoate cleavage protein [Methylobacterium fujisawaense]|uniref:3-keto-5-aminohexanoate cleavage protein n=1 Tax=Methylobacterium fujisawaense TaxID=107400 RepID=UPI0031F50B86
MAASNEQLVARVVNIARIVGRDIAIPAEARASLRLCKVDARGSSDGRALVRRLPARREPNHGPQEHRPAGL